MSNNGYYDNQIHNTILIIFLIVKDYHSSLNPIIKIEYILKVIKYIYILLDYLFLFIHLYMYLIHCDK